MSLRHVRLCLLSALATAAFSSCQLAHDENLEVNRFRLRDATDLPPVNTLARAETQKILYGAVTIEERRGREGEYYNVRWNLEPKRPTPSRIVFRYQQARSASRVLSLTHPITQHSGHHAFALTGRSFQANGRVLAWKATLETDDGTVLESQQSYLWQD